MADMLSYKDLQNLRTALADETVLSVYIAAEEHDFGNRSAWRPRLANLLEETKRSITGQDEKESFLAAAAKLEEVLRPVKGFLPGTGWAVLATKDTVWWSGQVLAPTPDLVRWGRGPVIAPHLRALKQNRPVAIALVDSRHARIFRYHKGELSEVRSFTAETIDDDLSADSVSKRGGKQSGVRGQTGTDAAQRNLLLERDRMLKEAGAELSLIAGTDGFVVIGGTPEATAAAGRLLGPVFGDRLELEPSLYLTMSPAKLREAAEGIASRLSAARQHGLVGEILDSAGAGGHGASGAAATREALKIGQVDELLLTAGYAAANVETAERLIALAMESGAEVEEVGGAAGARLDAEGGVCARLRFVRQGPASVAGA